MSQGLSGDAIVNPGAANEAIRGSTFASRHPTIGLTASGKSRDPRRPHIPATTPFSKNQPDEKHIRENIPLSSMREEDPREAETYHLAEIGKTFGAAFKSGMSASLYHSVRSVLIDLTAFLAEMEKKLCCPTDASKKLEAQVMRIDSFILEQRQLSGQAQAVSSEIDVVRNSVAPDSSVLASSVTALEQQSPDFFVPPELLEDWDWAFSFN